MERLKNWIVWEHPVVVAFGVAILICVPPAISQYYFAEEEPIAPMEGVALPEAEWFLDQIESRDVLIDRHVDLNAQLGEMLNQSLAHTMEANLFVHAGNFTITAYCPCEVCCEQYASDRPSINGDDVVFTADGSFAQEGITVGVQPNTIPFGTKLYIEGVGVRIAQDTGSGMSSRAIDVYYRNHESALASGLECVQRNVYIIREDF